MFVLLQLIRSSATTMSRPRACLAWIDIPFSWLLLSLKNDTDEDGVVVNHQTPVTGAVSGGGWCRVEDGVGWRTVFGGGRCRAEDGVGWRTVVVNCQTPVTGALFSQ